MLISDQKRVRNVRRKPMSKWIIKSMTTRWRPKIGDTFKWSKHFLSRCLRLMRLKRSWNVSRPEKEVSLWSSKRIDGILWNFAWICAWLDFTCGGFLDWVDYLVDNLFIPCIHGPPQVFYFPFPHNFLQLQGGYNICLLVIKYPVVRGSGHIGPLAIVDPSVDPGFADQVDLDLLKFGLMIYVIIPANDPGWWPKIRLLVFKANQRRLLGGRYWFLGEDDHGRRSVVRCPLGSKL